MNRQLTNRYGSVNFWDPFFAPFFEEDNERNTHTGETFLQESPGRGFYRY